MDESATRGKGLERTIQILQALCMRGLRVIIERQSKDLLNDRAQSCQRLEQRQ